MFKPKKAASVKKRPLFLRCEGFVRGACQPCLEHGARSRAGFTEMPVLFMLNASATIFS
jgi:hypothetical protein